MASMTVDGFVRCIRALVATTEAGHLSDKELLRRFVQEKDGLAFTVLIQRHGPMVLSIFRRMLHHVQDAEDAFQATFLVLAVRAHSIRRPTSLAPWLHGVAHRIAAHARAQANRQRVHPLEEEVAVPFHAAEAAAEGELCSLVNEELGQLPEKYRAPVILCYLEERTQDEAANQLGWSKSTLRRRLAEGLELLRGRLIRRGATLSTTALATLLAPRAAPASAELVNATAKAGLLAASGSAAAAVVSARVSFLMAEGGKALALSKLKLGTFAVLAATLIVAGAGLLANPFRPTEPPQAQPGGLRPAAAEEEPLDPLPRGALARFGSARLQHGRPITALRFTRNSQRLFSASEDFTVRMWDAATGKELQLFMTGTSRIVDMALLNDGKQVAMATHKEGVFIYDATSGLRVKQLGDNELQTVAVTPDGRTLFTGGPQGIQVFNLDDDNKGRKLTSTQEIPTRLVVSPDGKWLVNVNTGSRSIEVIDWQNDKEKWRGKMGGPVAAVAFFQTGRLIAAAQVNDASELWRVNLNEPRPTPEVLDLRPLTEGQRITHVVLGPAGETVYTVATNQELRALDLESGKLRFAVKAGLEGNAICSLEVSPDGKTLATGGGVREHTIRLWDAATGQERTMGLAANRSELFGLSVSKDGKVVAAGNATQRMTIWDGMTGRTLHEIDRPAADMLLRVAVSPDGKLVASSGMNGVTLWDVRTGKLLCELDIAERIHPVQFSPDGRLLIGGSTGGNLFIWHVESRQQIRSIKAHTDEVWCLDISPDGSMVATASFDQSAAVFNVATGQQLARRKDYEWYVRTIAFSPDGLCVATGGEGSNAIFVWEAATGQLVQQLVPEWPAISLAWCAGGRVLVSSHYYDRLHFWDLATGKWLAMSRHRPGPFSWQIVASADGRKVYTAGSDSVVRVWDVAQLAGELPPLGEPPGEALEAAWAALGKRDPAEASRGVWRLAAAGDRAVQLLADKLKPAKQQAVDETAIRRLLRELDDDVFAVREAATSKLSKADPAVLPILEKELKETESLEVRLRLERIIGQFHPVAALLSPAELQAARALQVLIYLDTPASRKLLENVAKGPAAQFASRQAKVALERMKLP